MSILGSTTAGGPPVDYSTPNSGGIVQAASQAADAVSQPSQAAASNPTPSQPAPAAPQQTSRLGAIIGAVSTALQGIPDRGRPSFATGLGEGARAEQAAQATQQAIKFRNFDDQLRLATLHNQDLKLQNDTQAQTDAHVKAELDNRALAESMGIDYDTLPSHGPTVMDHLTAQTAANGAASVPPGTHLSGDGETINIPKDTQATRDGQKQMYNTLAPALGLPPLPEGAQFVPAKNMNMLTNKIHGFDLSGNPYKHDDLPGIIAAAQAQRDQLAKNDASPAQLQALDNVLGIYKANLDALDKHAASVKQQSKQAELDAENSPQSIAGAAKKAGAVANAELPSKLALQNNKNDSTELNAVAFDPNYQNADGTKGANVVMSKADAQAKGLTHYKADPSTINTVVAGMNDVQNKLNQLAGVANNRNTMAQVDPGLAAAMLAHGKGITLSVGGGHGGTFGGVEVDTSRVNEDLYSHDVAKANQATRDFVSAFIGAHEAITQLPRLQTFGKSNRMTEKQMEAAINLLPQPGDREFAAQKMTSLQGMIDPLRKQIPHMPGAEQTPSWLEQQRQQKQTPSGGSNLGRVVTGNAMDLINSLRPSN